MLSLATLIGLAGQLIIPAAGIGAVVAMAFSIAEYHQRAIDALMMRKDP